jgi:hypothetical protein
VSDPDPGQAAPEDEPPSEGNPQTGAEDRPRPLMGAAFWIALAFGLVCVAAGWLVARLGPQLLAHHVPAPMS